MTKRIFFSRVARHGVLTGREKLSRLLWSAFTHWPGGVSRVDAPIFKRRAFGALLAGIRGWLDGLEKSRVDDCISQLSGTPGSGAIFIDGSNYGRLAREIKTRLPEVVVITFFHNVEFRFFWDAFTHSRSLRAFAVAICNFLAERQAVRYSDVLVFLNERDAAVAARTYPRESRGCRIEIFPMCLEDDPSAPCCAEATPESPPVGLFVGGAFFANVDGMRWFAENVAPQISCTIYVVGKGFELYREEISTVANVKVIGTVDSVSEWYAKATFIVSPIFAGSGMKTKTAEAAQFGRPILATSEAFTGFESHVDLLGRTCNTAQDFIDAIGRIEAGTLHFDPSEIRRIFAEHYSEVAAINRMNTLLGSCLQCGERDRK